MTADSMDVSPHSVNNTITKSAAQENNLNAVLKDIKNAKKTITEILEKDIGESQDSQRLIYFLHALRIFQAEFSAHLKAWNEITQIVEVENST
jgi:hypothetical protein